MANNIQVTQGTGTVLTTEQCSADSSHMEVVRLSYSAAGVRTYIQADVNGLLVNVGQVQGTVTIAGAVTISGTPAVTVINAASTTIAVSAPNTAPVAVRLSSGSAFVDTIPVSIAATVVVSGTVGISGSVAATQSGGWNIGTVTSITDTVVVSGTVALSGTSVVSGTVTANQGTAAAVGSSWPILLSDGTHSASLTNFSGSYALNVNVLGQVGGGVSQADSSTFTATTTAATPMAAVFNDSIATVASGKAGALRMTSFRALHHNLRDSSGNEIGLVGQPLYVQVTGGVQAVSGTITADQGGAPWTFNHTQINGAAVVVAAAGVQTVGIVSAAGVPFSQVAPLQTQNAPSGNTGGAAQTPWKNHLVIAPSQTAAVIHTAAGGKTAYIEGFSIQFTVAGTGTTGFVLFDNANTAATTLWACQTPWAFLSVIVTPTRPIPLSATGNSLSYTSSLAMVGDITAWGYDA